MQPVSKLLYIGGYLGTLGVGLLVSAVVAITTRSDSDGNHRPAPLGLVCVALLPILGAFFLYLALVYKAWAAIQDRRIVPRTTPGAAVGFLFVPFYNLYWMFQVFYGWAQDYNRYIRKLGAEDRTVSEGLPLTACILLLLVGVPYLGPCFALAAILLLIVFMNSMCDGINAIAELRRAGASDPGYDDNPFSR